MLAWYPGFLKPPSRRCLAFPCERFKIGNKVAASPRGRQEPSFVWQNVTLKFCKNSLREAPFRQAFAKTRASASSLHVATI